MALKVNVERVAAIALFISLIFCLASATFTLARCQPNSIVKDIEIDCKWKGSPVSANLKWTEPKV